MSEPARCDNCDGDVDVLRIPAILSGALVEEAAMCLHCLVDNCGVDFEFHRRCWSCEHPPHDHRNLDRELIGCMYPSCPCSGYTVRLSGREVKL